MARTPAKKSSAKKPAAKKSASKPKRSAKTAPAAKKTTKKKVAKSTKTKTAKKPSAKASSKTSPKTKRAKPKATRAKATTKTTRAKATKPKATRAKAKPAAKKSRSKPEVVTIDRRLDAERRDDEPTALEPVVVDGATLERREKVNRRRQIDPTTCERDYSENEVEFMNAMDEYKRTNGRMFPTCSEVLEVIRELGYVQLNPAEIAARKATEAPAEGDFDSQVEADAQEALEFSGEFRAETLDEVPAEAELVD